MRPFSPALVLFVWILLIVPIGTTVAEEKAKSPERVWKPHNLRWTLPGEGWYFDDVTPEQQGYGYITKVVTDSDVVEFYAGKKSAKGLNLTHLSLEMLEEGRDEFGKIDSFNQGTGQLAGLDGIHVWVRGTIGGTDAYVSYHCVLNKGSFYYFYARCWKGSEDGWGPEIDELRDGLQFLKKPKAGGKQADTTPSRPKEPQGDVPEPKKPAAPAGVAGPIAGLVGASTEPRGEHQGTELEIRRMAVILTKPAALSSFEPTGYQVCAFETRTDKSSYFYFDAVSQPKRMMTKDDLPKFVSQRAEEWMSAAGDAASIGTAKNKKPKCKKAKWSKGKGVCWEFEGEHGGTPFIEHGWVVIFKQRIFIVRVQLGGVGAAKKYKKLLKTIEKNWTFE